LYDFGKSKYSKSIDFTPIAPLEMVFAVTVLGGTI
jgi:hypothetical protein